MRTAAPLTRGTSTMWVVVREPYADLELDLREAFAGDKNVHIVVDRRVGERRARHEPVSTERRHADRRRPVLEVLELRISP